jgi:hypothetical protein
MNRSVYNAPIKNIRSLGDLFIRGVGNEEFTIMLKAYLDASGKPTDTVAVIAGFVASEDKWTTFEEKWTAFLDQFEIQRFHSAGYWSRAERPFNRWKEAKWLSAQSAICEAISSVQLLGVGVALEVELFRKWRMTLDQYYPNDAYYFCLDRVLYRLITGIGEAPKDEGVTIYIDRDKE